MITSNYQVDGDIYSYADKFFCDSHDDKPSNADARDGLINGAILEETDTGKTYIFDKKANQWTEKAAGGGGGGSPTLAGLTDVDISNPSNGQTLVYNATSHKWENGAGGGPLIVQVNEQGVLDKTWQEIHDCAPLVWLEGSNNGIPAYLPLKEIGQHQNSYICVFPDVGGDVTPMVAVTDSPNGYPVFVDG